MDDPLSMIMVVAQGEGFDDFQPHIRVLGNALSESSKTLPKPELKYLNLRMTLGLVSYDSRP